MIRYVIGAAALATALPGAANAGSISGDAAVDALVADISAGNRAAAIARIASIESVTGLPRLVATPAQFVDRLLGCTPRSADKAIATMPTVDWTCADGTYRTAFDSKYSAPYLVVGEFADPARVEMLARPRIAPPPVFAPPAPPPPGAATGPAKKALEQLGEALRDGKADAFARLLGPTSHVSFGRRDPVARVTLVELDGQGGDAFRTQVATARDRVGRIASVECHVDGAFGVCTVRSRTPQTGLVVMVSGQGEVIRSVNMMFVSP